MTVLYNLQGELPQRSAIALGIFDGLHVAHQRVIASMVERAKQQGLTPCVLTFSFERGSPQNKQVGQKLVSRSLRNALLEGLGVELLLELDFLQFRGLSPEEFVFGVLCDQLGAQLVSCGADFHFGRGATGTAQSLGELGAQRGMEVLVEPMLLQDGEPISSTRIRGHVREGEMPQATALLGRYFAIDFTVVHGKKLGRTLDAPTINQPLPDDFVVPRYGVYATLVTLGGKRHVAVTNLGVNPTVGGDAVLAETFIKGFDGDLYGQKVLVEFLEFLRSEEKFDSLEQLREAIHRDCAEADAICARYLGESL